MSYFLERYEKETITRAFEKIVKDSGGKPTKIWVDKGNEFYNRSLK